MKETSESPEQVRMASGSMELDRLAYEQASRALDQQAGVLDELRQRTSTLVAVSALVATFLGGRALDAPKVQQGPRLVLALALLALLAGVSACLLVLLPTRTRRRAKVERKRWRAPAPAQASDVMALAFTMNVETLLDRAEEGGLEIQSTPLLEAARTLQLAWNENQMIIAAKQKVFVVGAVALAAQTAGWIAFIALGREVI